VPCHFPVGTGLVERAARPASFQLFGRVCCEREHAEEDNGRSCPLPVFTIAAVVQRKQRIRVGRPKRRDLLAAAGDGGPRAMLCRKTTLKRKPHATHRC
jgi:hypothetical protein